ncbi:hypothetical protein AB0C76_03260 [Kitasatospora sp. NPDC048722]|uniref:hypothetical protein n=1 Tax=Kitasatospora sp. NPDC048722 TaxID=3155639 RepID=UPI0033D7BD11
MAESGGSGGGGGADYPWEKALKAFGNPSPVSRDDVANPAIVGDWIRGSIVRSSTLLTDGKDNDVVVTAVLKKSDGSTWYVGLNGNYGGNGQDKPGFDFANNKWDQFVGNIDLFMPALVLGGENKATSRPSLASGAYLVKNLGALLDLMKVDIHAWGNDLDVADSDFQGTAAGELKSFLASIENALLLLEFRIKRHGDPVKALDDAQLALGDAYTNLTKARDAWRNFSTKCSPIPCLREALTELLQDPMLGKGTDGNDTVLSGGLDVRSDAFLSAVESRAKQLWKNYVADNLDKPALGYLGTLSDKFADVSASLYTDIPTETPAPAPITAPNPDGTGGGGGGGGGDGKDGGGGPGGKDGNDKLNLDGGAGGGDGKGGDKHGGGPLGLNGGGPPPPKHGGPLTLDPNGGGAGGSRVPLLDKDGKPLLGKDGQPLTVPPGSTIDGQGRVIGPDHKPVLGPGGTPLVVPKGTKLGAPTPVVPGGGFFTVPSGSKIDENGMVLGPDGKQLRDARGNPVYAGKKGSIDKDGRLLDANGKPVTTNEQLFADEEHALNSLTTLDPATSNGGFDLGSLRGGNRWSDPGSLDLADGLSGSLGGGRLSIPDVDVPKPETASGSPLTLTGGFYGDKAVSENGAVNSPADRALLETARKAAAEQALTEKAGPKPPNPAQEEAQLQGRNVATSSGGMPPMMPPGGMGAGAGAPQDGKERQRTTWLAEEEEVWGTDAGAVSGVIGR